MKKLWTHSGFVALTMVLITILPVSYKTTAQPYEKFVRQNRKREILVQVEKEVIGLRNAELQKQLNTENAPSTSTKSSEIKEIPAMAAVSESDSMLLVNFYNATGGPEWTNNTNWLAAPINTWYGVTVENDMVTELRMKKNNLSGNIPPELGQLTSLQYLELDTNRLTGSIPTELGNLTELEYLYLSGNRLTGTIPVELLQLTNLILLYLSDNQLIGTIPDGIEQLSGLRWLNLGHNQFSGSIPAETGQLSLLQFLNLEHNQFFDTIPFSLGQLSNLRWLVLSENQLSGKVPVELANLSNLEQLYLDANQLSDTIPSELGQLINLRWLNLGQNQLTGAIPGELEQLTNLSLLYLNENQLTGPIPVEIGQLPELRWMNFSQNQLTGDIPEEIWQLTNLDLIYLNTNQLTGTLPGVIGQISGMEWIDLSENQIAGAVPDEINLLSNLQILDLNSNQFSSLPEINLQDSLNYVDVSNNLLSFEDLEYNMDLGLSIDFFYVPQDSIGASQTIAKKPGASISFAAPTGGEHNNYQWYKNDMLLNDQTASVLFIDNLAYEDSGKYYCVVTNDIVTGLTLTSRPLLLNVDENAETCQKLFFTEGWQIFSAPVLPDSADLKFLFQALIDNSTVMKIQDENGDALENTGSFGGWRNNIGDINPGEGYLLKAGISDSIEICGSSVDYPYSIPLKTGWNIIGFPLSAVVDAMEVIQPLIDNESLEKVQSETGDAIENLESFGGWRNRIGNFVPGKGYKIKLSKADTIRIQADYEKTVVFLSPPAPLNHFKPAFFGNGVDHMNINIGHLPVNFFKPGDELAVYDGEVCAGAVTLTPDHLNNNVVSIAVSASDEFGMPGFKAGNPVVLKLWSSAENEEVDLNPELLNGTSIFAKHESTLMSLEKYALTGFDDEFDYEKTEINCYPNPFSDEIILEIRLAKDSEVQVRIYNQPGQQIKTLSNRQHLSPGTHRFTWNGRNHSNQKVPSGIYFVEFTTAEFQQFKKIVLSNR